MEYATDVVPGDADVSIQLLEDNRLNVSSTIALALDTILADLSCVSLFVTKSRQCAYRPFLTTFDATFSAG